MLLDLLVVAPKINLTNPTHLTHRTQLTNRIWPSQSVSAKGATLPPITIATDADSRDAVRQHLAEHAHLIASLRSLLGIAKALGRRLVLPRMLCYCDYMWKEMRSCRVGGAETMRLPFDCPMDHVLDTPRFFENTLNVQVRCRVCSDGRMVRL